MPPPPPRDPTPVDPSSYALTPEQSEHIFLTQIYPAEIAPFAQHSHARDAERRPLAVLLVGQTGAGKTRTAPALHAALAAVRGHPPAHFIADTYKTHHPAYAALVAAAAAQAAQASQLTSPAARAWLARACSAAAADDLRLDVLVESACRQPEDFSEIASLFRARGYAVIVALLAVPEALSRLGILARFYGGLPEAGSRGLPPRLTPRRIHELSYRGLESAAAFIDASDAVDAVVVVRRGNLVGYANARAVRPDQGAEARGFTPEWERTPSGVAAALATERKRPLTEEEQRAFAADMERLRHQVPAEQAAELDEIQQLMESSQIQDGLYEKLLPLDCDELLRRWDTDVSGLECVGSCQGQGFD